MSSRDEILERVWLALGDVANSRPADTAPRDYISQSFDDVVGRFCEVAADYRATVHRGADAAGLIAEVLATEDVTTVVVPHDLSDELVAGFTASTWPVRDGAEDRLTHRELDVVDAVVTTARVAIAATGTVVLDHGVGQGRRALTLVPDLHVCVVTVDQVVADVPDAIALLDPRRPQTWISGPSATSDIELDRVEGVHGPRRLHIVVVPALP